MTENLEKQEEQPLNQRTQEKLIAVYKAISRSLKDELQIQYFQLPLFRTH